MLKKNHKAIDSLWHERFLSAEMSEILQSEALQFDVYWGQMLADTVEVNRKLPLIRSAFLT